MTGVCRLFDNSPAVVPVALLPPCGHRQTAIITSRWPVFVTCATVLVIVMAAPVPLASNHPLAWLFWATLLAAVATLLNASHMSARGKIQYQERAILAIGAIFAGFAIFQALPLPMIQGGLTLNFPGGSANLPSLSIAPGETLIAAVRTVSYLLFFWLALRAGQNVRRAKKLGSIILFSIAAHALFAIIALKLFSDVNFLFEKNAYPGKATGTFINKNSFATFLGMGTILGLALIFDHSDQKTGPANRLARKFQIISVAIILLALLLTQSRMGMASTLMASLFVVSWPAKQNARIAALFCVGLALIFLVFGAQLFAIAPDLISSLSTRLELYKQLFGMILARPVTGFGLGSFSLAYELYHAPPVTANFVWDRGHSTYLTLWVEAGIIFGSAPVLAGWIAMRRLSKISRRPGSGRAMARAGLGALILGAVHSTTDFSLEIQANSFLLIALVALALGPADRAKGETP